MAEVRALPPRRLALVDVNNFYASCETVFQPHLRGRPVVVLSNNDGCVVARSPEAKALNITMTQPWHQVPTSVQRQVVVFSSNYTLYADMSARVMRILRDMAPRQEVYSIDESFLDLSGIRDLCAHGRAIRQRVQQWTGLT
ncbi:MAG: DNA polymerase V subunit UmuC, partial [Oceanococcaceae bacterium]